MNTDMLSVSNVGDKFLLDYISPSMYQLESELLDKVVAENDWVLAQVMGVGKLSRFYYTFQEKVVSVEFLD